MARRPGEVRDAIDAFLESRQEGATMGEIYSAVSKRLGGEVAKSSVRSYLRLNEGTKYQRIARGRYRHR
jgi:hypothetical protein